MYLPPTQHFIKVPPYGFHQKSTSLKRKDLCFWLHAVKCKMRWSSQFSFPWEFNWKYPEICVQCFYFICFSFLLSSPLFFCHTSFTSCSGFHHLTLVLPHLQVRICSSYSTIFRSCVTSSVFRNWTLYETDLFVPIYSRLCEFYECL